jgi:hypothetical protein
MVCARAVENDAARHLNSRVLLQLPRLADAHGFVSQLDAAREIENLARQEAEPPTWLSPPEHPPSSPRDLTLIRLDDARAQLLHERFHYLRSYRQGLHLAGEVNGHIAAILTFSPLDLDTIRAALPTQGDSLRALVLSRVYAATWAPRNSLSRLLSLAARRFRDRDPSLGLLLTYLNPGIGFDGASYKAANWQLLGREHGTRYAYLDESYVTDRVLTGQFGTSSETELRGLLGDRIVFSRMRLQPLDMYAFALHPRQRRVLAATPPRDWLRPWH